MTSAILSICGGLGLFLLGMSVMTDGLKNLAGNALRRWLSRFTHNATTGAATGAVSTALIQSSSATTVMAVGFVSAGLMTFPESLGIIFGANIGTTVTGWLVALLGFKLSLKEIVLPLIFLGALLRLFGRKRIANIGIAVAGFGLVFAGIAMLQQGMVVFKDVVTPASFPPDTVVGRLLLVLIGIAITLVTQSSSAGVATAITAVHVGNISLAQAAAMVIGMDVGTTVTAAMASIGASVDARRTGLAHVIYNLLTGCGAFMLLPFFINGWEAWAPAKIQADPEIALVAFHTTFNFLGVILALPLTGQFARLVTWIVPSRDSDLTRRLDNSLLDHPVTAIAAVHATLLELTQTVFQTIADSISRDRMAPPSLSDVQLAVSEVRNYLATIDSTASDGQVYREHAAALHALDHLARLIVRFERKDRLQTVLGDQELHEMGKSFASIVDRGAAGPEQLEELILQLETLWTEFDQRMEPLRRETIERSARSDQNIELTIARLDAARWLRRICYHAWRICFHLSSRQTDADAGVEIEPESID